MATIIEFPDDEEQDIYDAVAQYRKNHQYKNSKLVKMKEQMYRGKPLHTANNWIIGIVALGLWILGIWKLIEIVF